MIPARRPQSVSKLAQYWPQMGVQAMQVHMGASHKVHRVATPCLFPSTNKQPQCYYGFWNKKKEGNQSEGAECKRVKR